MHMQIRAVQTSLMCLVKDKSVQAYDMIHHAETQIKSITNTVIMLSQTLLQHVSSAAY